MISRAFSYFFFFFYSLHLLARFFFFFFFFFYYDSLRRVFRASIHGSELSLHPDAVCDISFRTPVLCPRGALTLNDYFRPNL